MKQSAKAMPTPNAIPFDSQEHNSNEVDAVLSITRTEHIPLVFGRGDMTPGQIIDEMISKGEVTKIVLNMDKDNF